MTSDFHATPRTLAPLPLSHPLGPPRAVPRISKRSNACTACKTRRIKCRGSQPCDNCVTTNRTCVFLVEHDRRRKNALRRAEQELNTVQQHLDRILEVFKVGDKAQLDYLLATAAEYRTASAAGPAVQDGMFAGTEQSAPGLPNSSWSTPPTFPAPSFISAGISGQGESLTEDPNRDEASRATGYIGSASEIAWLQELGDKVNSLPMHREHSPTIDDSAAAMNYHLDNIQIPETISVDPRSLPPKPWATTLLGLFFESVYPSFPVVNKSFFIIQFEQAYTSSAAQASRKWLAVLNLILALGSRYYQESEPDSGRDVDDRVYLSRALALATTPAIRTSYAGLQQVQIELLLAIYYLASGQVNQSWQTNGRAARLAISMGLNLCVDGDQIDPVSEETRTRIWWSIFTLEHVLSGMTGRPPCIDCQSMSVRLPLPFDEAQFRLPAVEELLNTPTARERKLKWTVNATESELYARDRWLVTICPRQSLYFFHLVDLSVIMQVASKAIYGLAAAKDNVEGNISFYRGKLKLWLSSLQPAFAFTTHNANVRRRGSGEMPGLASNCRERTSLALAYYSSQVVLTRSCLTYPAVQTGTNALTPRSRFGDDMAKSCIHFALALVSVLPDQPDMRWISKLTSWWCLLHSIMRALTVLLIQLSIGQVPVRSTSGEWEGIAREGEGIDAVRDASKKILLWLHSMAKQDPSSKRAFHIGQRLFSTIARTNGFDLQGVASLMAEQDASRLKDLDLGSFSPRSLKLQGDLADWGPDFTGSESGYEQDQVPFVDPALLSFEEYRF
ncbi:fungal-specific transcription factor domain-containing protein [Aspergillus similis]